MALNLGETAQAVKDRMDISVMLTHCKKCGSPLIATKARDHTPPLSAECYTLITFTCRNQRVWNSHSKEFLSLLGYYKNIKKKKGGKK